MKTTVDLPDQIHRALRVKAILEGRSMNALIVDAVENQLGEFRVESNGKHQEEVAATGRERRS